MDFGSHEAWKGADGAADAAWNETGSSPSSATKFATVISASSPLIRGSGSRQTKGGSNSGSSSSRGSSQAKAGPPCLPPTGEDGKLGCVILEVPPALILEIFTHLDARELSVVACVCSLFRRLASDSHGWKYFYCERWGLPASSGSEESPLALPGKHWKALYVAKEVRSKSMMLRFSMDMLHGHTDKVRAVRLLPAANLICTAGYDQTVRLWNLEEGLPVAISRTLGETIRAIAVDMTMLVVGGTDAVLRVWRANPACPHLFDVGGLWNSIPGKGPETGLHGHTGPVTCLGLDELNIYSGSWDMSIKVWSRTTLKCSHNLRHMDWVWSLVVRGGRVLSTAGSDVYTWDAQTGKQLRVRKGVHSGQAYAVEGTRSGHIVFTGGEDGAVRMFDDRISRRKSSMADLGEDCSAAGLSGLREAVASWNPHSSAVYSLAFDDPWLVSASGDGSLAMMDVRQILKRASGASKPSVGGNSKWRRSGQYLVSKEGETAQRRLAGFHHSAYSVDLGADRVVSGGEEKIVRIWDFSQALEIERRVQASKSSQIEHRVRRKQQQVAVDSKGKDADDSLTDEEIDVGGERGFHKPDGKGRAGKNKGPKDVDNLSVQRGTRGKSPIHTGPVREFMRTRARYVDSVSVPS
ncbi:unnamed protein product [Calypogeia fissa]